MTNAVPTNLQPLPVDDFLYFFLSLRKDRIRRVVVSLQTRFPQESREQIAARLIDSHASLSLIGGSLFHVPALLPGLSRVSKLLGLAAGASVLTRAHLYMILEIAHVYGKDIDDQARVPEVAAVVAATAAVVAAPALAVQLFGVTPLLAIPAAGLTATALTRLIGKIAVDRYSKEAHAAVPEIAPGAAPAPASA